MPQLAHLIVVLLLAILPTSLLGSPLPDVQTETNSIIALNGTQNIKPEEFRLYCNQAIALLPRDTNPYGRENPAYFHHMGVGPMDQYSLPARQYYYECLVKIEFIEGVPSLFDERSSWAEIKRKLRLMNNQAYHVGRMYEESLVGLNSWIRLTLMYGEAPDNRFDGGGMTSNKTVQTA